MFPFMMDVLKPQIESFVDVVEALTFKTRKETLTNRSEKSFDLSFSLRLIGPGMNQGDAKGCADMLKMMTSICRAVIGIKFFWQTPPEQALLEGIQKTGKPFREIKLSMRNKPGMIIEKGYKVGLPHLLPDPYHRAVHHIGLPDLVCELGLELAPA